MFKSRSGGRGAAIAAGLVAASLAGCFTYSASITAEPKPTIAASELVARAQTALAEVAGAFSMEPSALDLEGMQRSAKDEGSEYLPVVVYRNTYRSAVRDSRRIVLMLEQHRNGDSVRVIIRDLERDDVTEFTESIEQDVVKRLTTKLGSDAIRVQRGRVRASIYAP